MFYDHLIGREAPRKDIYQRAIKAPLIKHTSSTQPKSDKWSPDKATRRLAQDRIKKLQRFMRKNWRLRLLFERGRTAPLHTVIRAKAKERRTTKKTSKAKPSSLKTPRPTQKKKR